MPKKWEEAILLHSEWSTPRIKRFWFKNVAGKFDFRAGQFITFDLPVGEKRIDRWRSYSIASQPDGSNIFEVALLFMPGGGASEYLVNELTPGQSVFYQGPKGIFTLPKEKPPRCFFLCTGTGVVPFRSMLIELYENKFEYPVHLIYGSRLDEDVIYREEFLQYAELYDHFSYDICLSREEVLPVSKHPRIRYHKGYVHKAYREMTFSDQDVFYICGWSEMIDEAFEKLQELGIVKENIRVELYG